MNISPIIIILTLLFHTSTHILTPIDTTLILLQNKSIKTSLGKVDKIKLNDPIPEGWRIMRFEQGKQIAGELGELIDKWGIVGFDYGKLDGCGYGSKISDTRGPECGELFIIQDRSSNELEIEKKTKTSLGMVAIIDLEDPIPKGWRALKLHEGKQIKHQLDKILQKWDVVGFDCGKIDGAGYGGKISDTRGPECGELFIIEL